MIKIWYLRLSGRQGWAQRSSPSLDLPRRGAGSAAPSLVQRPARQRGKDVAQKRCPGCHVPASQSTDSALCLQAAASVAPLRLQDPSLSLGAAHPPSRTPDCCSQPRSQQNPKLLLSSSPSCPEAFAPRCRVKPPPAPSHPHSPSACTPRRPAPSLQQGVKHRRPLRGQNCAFLLLGEVLERKKIKQ